MSERATVFNNLQLGIETTPGTAVATTAKLLGTYAALHPRTPVDSFRPTGQKFTTDVTLQKEYSEGDITGILCYTDIAYLLSSLISNTSLTTFNSSPTGPDSVQTYTVDFGSSLQAERAAYGLVTGLELRFTKEQCALSGTMIARTLQESVTIAAGPTDVAKAPVSPKSVNIFVGDTVGGLAKITKCVEASWAMRNKAAPFFTFDSSQDSFLAHVERASDYTASLVVEHDSVGAGYMADLRTAKTKFMRIKSTGGSYGAGNYDIQITFPFKFREPTRGDNQNVFCSTYQLQPIYDSTFGQAIEIILAHGLVAL